MPCQRYLRYLVSIVLVALLVSTGCTSTPPPEGAPVNETSTLPVLHHGEIAINLSEIEMKDPELFTANLTSTISTVLQDSRATLLLDHGWNITSVRQEFDEEILERPYVCVEFMKNDLSFYFWVDEEEGRVLSGYCGAKVWVPGDRHFIPNDYTKMFGKHTRWWYVQDFRDGDLCGDEEATVYKKNGISVYIEGEVMIYDKNEIYYLDPEF